MHPLVRIAATTLTVPVAYSLIEPHRFVVRRFDVELEGLPPELDGYVVAQMSDLHISAITSPNLLRRAVAICNDTKPNVIVLTGDYVSRRNSYSHIGFIRLWARPVMEYAEKMAREVAHLKAPDGVFAVPGNHDYSEGKRDAIESLLQRSGITMLVNRSVRLPHDLPLVGLDDLRAGRPQWRQACAGIDPEQPHIILSHNPRLFSLLEQRNCLLLTGHTHGGQVHLPLTSWRYLPADSRRAVWNDGWYAGERAKMYVNSGLGSVHFPLRFRCPPEIALFRLRVPHQHDESCSHHHDHDHNHDHHHHSE